MFCRREREASNGTSRPLHRRVPYVMDCTLKRSFVYQHDTMTFWGLGGTFSKRSAAASTMGEHGTFAHFIFSFRFIYSSIRLTYLTNIDKKQARFYY